jgi:phosphate starvation-inducible PhoH-like protein
LRTKSKALVVEEGEKRTPNKERIREIIKKPKEKFLTNSQKEYWDIIENNQITFCNGAAGTGKSHIALKKAIDLLWDGNNKYEKLIIIRPAVESSEKSLGALPGTVEEKIYSYMYPSIRLLHKIIGKESYEKLKQNDIIEFLTINFARGLSIDNSILVGEEFQNSSPLEMKLLLTRIGFNSKYIINGDIEQSDKFKDVTKSGLFDVKKRMQGLDDIAFFEFDEKDIVRNPLIGKMLKRYSE